MAVFCRFFCMLLFPILLNFEHTGSLYTDICRSPPLVMEGHDDVITTKSEVEFDVDHHNKSLPMHNSRTAPSVALSSPSSLADDESRRFLRRNRKRRHWPQSTAHSAERDVFDT